MQPESKTISELTDVIGAIPYRMAFAGGWIDQPFISCLNPNPPGSMVVVSLQPTVRFMEFSGMGTSTRKAAYSLWGETLPEGDPASLVRELYEAENQGKADPSGAQDMAGIIYPGISRLDFDHRHEGGFFPLQVESCNDPQTARWLEEVIYVVPIAQRPPGYSPLGEMNLDPQWIANLSQSGKDCYEAILARDAKALGMAMNISMICWEKLLPNTVRHPLIKLDLLSILKHYQERFAGAMYSGCGGGYLYVVSDEPGPGGFQVKVRLQEERKDS